jgi:hydroxymethylpyrimidine pyrophosphatase-like HAD family hydrolase
MRFLIEPLAIALPVGAFNGSCIVDPRLKVVEQHLIPSLGSSKEPRCAQRIRCRYLAVSPTIAGSPATATRRIRPARKTRHPRRSDRCWGFRTLSVGACKIVGSSADAALLQRCEVAMRRALGTEATAAESQSYYLDITPPGCDKGTFVQGDRQTSGHFDRCGRHHRRHAE